MSLPLCFFKMTHKYHDKLFNAIEDCTFSNGDKNQKFKISIHSKKKPAMPYLVQISLSHNHPLPPHTHQYTCIHPSSHQPTVSPVMDLSSIRFSCFCQAGSVSNSICLAKGLPHMTRIRLSANAHAGERGEG